jgi:riboflavin biosynthesis pyrimidine reductase
MDAMRALLPSAVTDPDLHEFYAADWLAAGGLRVNFVSSADGAVSLHGLSRGLQTAGDNRVFGVLRDLADVVLVGAGTARAENYRPVVPTDQRRRIRAEHDLPPDLPIALVSARLELDLAGPLFNPPAGAPRPIVITRAAAPADRLRAVGAVADLIVTGDDQVDLAAARAGLAERGRNRILSEGGPSLFADLLAQDTVDELCLTVSPLLASAGPGRITAGSELPPEVTPRLQLIGLLEEEHALFLRYRVAR